MKKSRIAKLALMGSSMAALAATLGTSTYAWYVANNTATVSGMTAATAGTEASGNLLVANLTAAANQGAITVSGNWGNSLSSVSLSSTPNLNPVTKDTTGQGGIAPSTGATGWHDAANAPVLEANAYGYYAFGIWSTDKTSVAINLAVTNNTETFKSQTLYSATGAPTSVSINDRFYKDAVEALRMEIIKVEFPASGDVTLSTVLGTTPLQTWAVDDFNQADHTHAYAADAGAAAGGNANSYYQAIMGTAPAGGATEATYSALTSGTYTLTVSKDVRTILLFRYWLEGTDTDCFDSCIGQSFLFDFEFEATSGSGSGN